jgi:curli biogenesis system outer membrane secretion channel CsgG
VFNKAKSFKTLTRMPARTLGVLSVAFALTGCISTTAGSDGRYAKPTGDAPVINNETPYSSALRCLANHVPAGAKSIRIAVGNIRDYTGKEEADGTGNKITQGASLMAMSALGRAGVPMVERFDTGVAELEMKYANNKLIGEGGAEGDYRKIYAGEVRGSDFYLVGGITEVNFNIRSAGAGISGASPSPTGLSASLTGNVYVMNVGLDLRLVNSRTLEVVDVVSYQKQIVGHEVKAGVVDFLNGNLFDIGAGKSAQEPVQLAVRAVLERAILKMLVPLYQMNPSDCVRFGAKGDPMGEIEYRQASPKNYRTTPLTEANATVVRRQPVSANSPYAYYSEPVFGEGLRGGSY